MTQTQGQAPAQAQPAASIYDVYYWSADAGKWVWYVAYHNGADVDRAIQSLRSQGFEATWQKRS